MITIHNKLVRNKIPSQIAFQGKSVTYRKLTDPEEVQKALISKLTEETSELVAAMYAKSKDNIIEELADLKEVVLAIELYYHIEPVEVDDVFYQKRVDKGYLLDNIFLETVEDHKEELH